MKTKTTAYIKKFYCAFYMVLFLSFTVFAENVEQGHDEEEFDVPEVEWDAGGENGRLRDGLIKEQASFYGYGMNLLQGSVYLNDTEFDNTTVGNALLLRLKGEWQPDDNLSFRAEAAYSLRTGNQNPYAIMQSTGLSTLSQESFPLYDFNSNFILDHAYASVNAGILDMQFGKVPIAWGSAYVFNPTMRTHSASFLDGLSEETPGTLAVIPSIVLSDYLSFEAYLAFQEKGRKQTAFVEDGRFENLPFGIKGRVIAGNFDIGLSFIKELRYNEMDDAGLEQMLTAAGVEYVENITANYEIAFLIDNGLLTEAEAAAMYADAALASMMSPQIHDNYIRRHYIGLDISGSILDIGLYAEAAFELPYNNSLEKFDFTSYLFSEEIEIACGFNYFIPVLEIQTRFEYYHQGDGVIDPVNYSIFDVITGKKAVQGRDYIFAYLDRIFSDILTLSLAGLVNLNDASAVLMPTISIEAEDNFQLDFGSYIFLGQAYDEFDGRYRPAPGYTVDLTESFSVYSRVKLSF